jgi:O-antigen/teichoic acid export membrane protein
VYVIPSALATVLFAAASAEPATLAHRLRFSLGLSLALTCLVNLLLLATAGPILSVFGAAYASNGAIPLVLFSLGAIPMTIREHFATIRRLKGRPLGAAPIILAGALGRIVLGAAGARLDGLTGLGIGLLITGCVEAVVLAPIVLPVAFGIATWSGAATSAATITSGIWPIEK